MRGGLQLATNFGYAYKNKTGIFEQDKNDDLFEMGKDSNYDV